MYGKTNAGAATGGSEVIQNGIEMVKLWENASPTSDFAAQSVALDLSAYDGALIGVCLGVQYPTRINTFYIPKGSLGYCTIPINVNYHRYASVSSTGVTFGGGNRCATYGTDTATNSWVVPAVIYGIKGVK